MESLIRLQNIYNMELVNVFLEPLQPYHRGFADDLIMKERAERLSRKFGSAGRFYHKYTKGLISLTTSKLSDYMVGHTILAPVCEEVMSDSRSISFIIPAYNCAETVRETVESIYNGNFNAGDEVILINDCSTDTTAEVLSELQAHYPAIRILNHRVNKGTAAASRNTGIEQSNNDLIFCLDADNVLVPNSVPKLKEHLLATKADAAAFGEMHVFNHATRAINYKWIFGQRLRWQMLWRGLYWPGPSGNYLFTKQSWLKAGRYFEPTLLKSND